MRYFGTLALGIMLVSGAVALPGCGEGPAEQAGERIDGNASGVRDKLTPDKSAEEAGKEIDRAVDDAND